MNSNAYIMGVVAGVLIVAAAALTVYFLFKKKSGPAKYDERQQVIRGKAYKYAFLILFSYSMLNGLFQLATGIEWADAMTSSFIGVCISGTVFVITCIKNDAYFAINQNPKTYYILFSGIFLLNLSIGMQNLSRSSTMFIKDGKLNFYVQNFIAAAVMLAMIIAMMFRAHSVKRNGSDV